MKNLLAAVTYLRGQRRRGVLHSWTVSRDAFDRHWGVHVTLAGSFRGSVWHYRSDALRAAREAVAEASE